MIRKVLLERDLGDSSAWCGAAQTTIKGEVYDSPLLGTGETVSLTLFCMALAALLAVHPALHPPHPCCSWVWVGRDLKDISLFPAMSRDTFY